MTTTEPHPYQDFTMRQFQSTFQSSAEYKKLGWKRRRSINTTFELCCFHLHRTKLKNIDREKFVKLCKDINHEARVKNVETNFPYLMKKAQEIGGLVHDDFAFYAISTPEIAEADNQETVDDDPAKILAAHIPLLNHNVEDLIDIFRSLNDSFKNLEDRLQ